MSGAAALLVLLPKVLAVSFAASLSWLIAIAFLDGLMAAVIIGYCLRPFILQFVKRPVTNHNLLLIGVVGVSCAFFLHQISFQTAQLAQQPWWHSLSLLLALVCLMIFVDTQVSKTLASSIGFDLSKLMPQVRVVKIGDAQNPPQSLEELRSISQIKVDSIVRLIKGDYVPCDGMVVNGQAEVEERRLSGLSSRRVKSPGLELWAGSRVISGEITYRTLSTAEDSFITFSRGAVSGLVDKASQELMIDSQRFGSIDVGILVGALFSGVLWLEKGASSFSAGAIVPSILLAGVLLRIVQLAQFTPLLAVTKLWTKGVLIKDLAVLDRLISSKAVVVELNPDDLPGASIVRNFEVIDERVDRPKLMAALLTLLGRSDAERDLEIARFLGQEVNEPLVKEVRGFQAYPDLGICGELDGIEFTIGTESLLLERGVQIQASESVGDSPDILYVALNDNLVARFDIGSEFHSYGKILVKDVQRQGLKTWLVSSASNEVVDPIAKEAGVELAYVAGGLAASKISEKLESVSPCIFYSVNPRVDVEAREPVVTMSVFDEVSWDLSRSSITVFCRRLEPIAEVVRIARKLHSTLLMLKWGGIAAAISCALLTYLVNPGPLAFAAFAVILYGSARALLALLGPGLKPADSTIN